MLRLTAGKTQSATFEPAQVKKTQNIDLQTCKVTATQKGLQSQTPLDRCGVSNEAVSLQLSAKSPSERKRERERKGTIFNPYSLVNGKEHLQSSPCLLVHWEHWFLHMENQTTSQQAGFPPGRQLTGAGSGWGAV